LAHLKLVAPIAKNEQFHSAGFARMIERAGIETKFDFKPHPHMLRHACG
jgi:site-specific recombinase XerD